MKKYKCIKKDTHRFNVQTHETHSLEKAGVSLDKEGKCIKPLGFTYVC